jgi:hypothetical protein
MIGDEIDFGTKVVARALQQIKRVRLSAVAQHNAHIHFRGLA